MIIIRINRCAAEWQIPSPQTSPSAIRQRRAGSRTELPLAAAARIYEMQLRSRPDCTSEPSSRSPSRPRSLTLQVPVRLPPRHASLVLVHAAGSSGVEALGSCGTRAADPAPRASRAAADHPPPALPSPRRPPGTHHPGFSRPSDPSPPASRCQRVLPGLTGGIWEKLKAAEQAHPDQ